MVGPEEEARERIDELLAEAGWLVQDRKAANLYARRGVAIRKFQMAAGHGAADYLLFVDQQPAGAVAGEVPDTSP